MHRALINWDPLYPNISAAPWALWSSENEWAGPTYSLNSMQFKHWLHRRKI